MKPDVEDFLSQLSLVPHPIFRTVVTLPETKNGATDNGGASLPVGKAHIGAGYFNNYFRYMTQEDDPNVMDECYDVQTDGLVADLLERTKYVALDYSHLYYHWYTNYNDHTKTYVLQEQKMVMASYLQDLQEFATAAVDNGLDVGKTMGFHAISSIVDAPNHGVYNVENSKVVHAKDPSNVTQSLSPYPFATEGWYETNFKVTPKEDSHKESSRVAEQRWRELGTAVGYFISFDARRMMTDVSEAEASNRHDELLEAIVRAIDASFDAGYKAGFQMGQEDYKQKYDLCHDQCVYSFVEQGSSESVCYQLSESESDDSCDAKACKRQKTGDY